MAKSIAIGTEITRPPAQKAETSNPFGGAFKPAEPAKAEPAAPATPTYGFKSAAPIAPATPAPAETKKAPLITEPTDDSFFDDIDDEFNKFNAIANSNSGSGPSVPPGIFAPPPGK